MEAEGSSNKLHGITSSPPPGISPYIRSSSVSWSWFLTTRYFGIVSNTRLIFVVFVSTQRVIVMHRKIMKQLGRKWSWPISKRYTGIRYLRGRDDRPRCTRQEHEPRTSWEVRRVSAELTCINVKSVALGRSLDRLLKLVFLGRWDQNAPSPCVWSGLMWLAVTCSVKPTFIITN
jgi:hypothetical protein